ARPTLFTPPPTTCTSTPSLHDALPILQVRSRMPGGLTQVVRVAQLDQSTALRRRRPQVQLLPWTPFFAPVPQQQQGELRKLVFRSEEHTSELQSRFDLVCRLLLEKKKK